jgi:uncharacterized damage-inducible protein DinB
MITRPTLQEHDPAFSRYIARVPEGHLIELFQLQTQNTHRFYEKLSEEKANYSYAPGKWSLKEVLGHIMDFERVFAYRTLCIARGEEQVLPGYDENDYARSSGYDRIPLSRLLQHYAHLRAATILLLEQIPENAWLRTGTVNQKSISLRALAYIMPGHELHHMNVIAERYM